MILPTIGVFVDQVNLNVGTENIAKMKNVQVKSLKFALRRNNPLISLSSIVVIRNQYNQLLHLFLEVDGSWEEWGEWFPCPGCGKELKKRKRKCNRKGNGRLCDGEAEEIESGKNELFDN